MPVYFSNIWNALIYNREEDPIEAYVVVPQELNVIPENQQFVNDQNIPNSPSLDAETSERKEVSQNNSSVESAASILPDESQSEAENEQSKYDLVAKDASTSLTRHATDESPDSNGEISPNIPQSSSESDPFSSSPEEKQRRKLFMFDTIATIIGFTVPLLTIGIGAENIGNCPADFHIPYLVLLMGILSMFIVSYAFLKCSGENFDYWTKLDEDVIFMASTIFVTLWLWKNLRFFAMDPSFDSTDNYCSYTFYIFNIYLDVLLGLGFIIGFCLYDLHSKSRPSLSSPDDDHWMALYYLLH